MTVSVIRLKGEEADKAAKISERLKSIWKIMKDAEEEKAETGVELDVYLKRIVFERSDELNGGNGVWYSPAAKQFVASDYDISLSDDEDSVVVVSKQVLNPKRNVEVIRLNCDEHEKVQELLAEARAHKARRNDLRDEKKRVEAELKQLLQEIALRENEEYRIAHEEYVRDADEIAECNKDMRAASHHAPLLLGPSLSIIPTLSNDGRSIVLLKK